MPQHFVVQFDHVIINIFNKNG